MNLKNVWMLLLCSACSFQLLAQNPVSAVVNTNEVKAVINSNGALFWDFSDGQFITPSTGGAELSTMRASGLWIAGLDPGGNIYGATQLYNENDKTDFIPGTINSTTTEAVELNKIWNVTAADIDQHQLDFADNGVIDNPVANVYAWPARGNAFFSTYNDGLQLPNTTQGLAPFWDNNFNGIYEPDRGDYPVLEIRGCLENPPYPTEMWWFVYHDNVPHSESNLEPLKMEVQTQVFAYACEEDTPLNQTVFVRHKMIYRGEQSLDNTRFGLFSDFEIGNGNDDFFGSDADRALVYAYNGDETDEGGYGDNAPAMAIDFFRFPLSELGEAQSLTQVMPVPVDETLGGFEVYNLLSGLNIDGTPAANDGFFYNGNPNNPNEPSEVSAGNTPGERRVLSVSPAFRLDPGAVNEFITAYTFHQEPEQTPLQNVATMYEENDDIQTLFDNCFDPASVGCLSAVSVAEVAPTKGKVFPNPTKNELNILLEDGLIQDITLFDMTGKTLLYQSLSRQMAQHHLNLKDLGQGMYLLNVRLTDGRVFKEKIVLMK